MNNDSRENCENSGGVWNDTKEFCSLERNNGDLQIGGSIIVLSGILSYPISLVFVWSIFSLFDYNPLEMGPTTQDAVSELLFQISLIPSLILVGFGFYMIFKDQRIKFR